MGQRGPCIEVGAIVATLALALSAAAQAAPGADFDGDGFGDLVVGVPGEDSAAGAVNFLLGSANGITGAGGYAQQGFEGLAETAEANDRFGEAVAAGDFNADGADDVAIGAPSENLGVGVVQVLFGGSPDVDEQVLRLGVDGLPGAAGEFDAFGSALAAGDFDGNGIDDLAISAPAMDITIDDPLTTEIRDVGAVLVIPGKDPTLNAGAAKLWFQGERIRDEPDAHDLFGESLATGDFNGDGRDDLAAGSPYERMGSEEAAGAVSVILGSDVGLTHRRNRFLTQGTPGIPGKHREGNHFAAALAAGDFNRDGRDDLAAGVPNEGERTGLLHPVGTGAAIVMPGSPEGTRGRGAAIFGQDTPGIRGTAEAGDTLGRSLAAGDFDRDRSDDLAVGSPGERDDNSNTPIGSVNVLYGGTGSGLGQAGDQRFEPGHGGVENDLDGFGFGRALAAGDFDDDRRADLAVGDPAEQGINAGDFNAGAVNVLYGAPAGLTVPSAQFFAQGISDVFGTREEGDLFGAALAGDAP